jgi:hypothetical protein
MTDRRTALTPQSNAVSRLVGEAQQRQADEATDGRGRTSAHRVKGVDKKGRAKMTLKLSVERQTHIREMAKAEDVYPADIVNYAVHVLYQEWKAGEVDLERYKVMARSNTVLWRLDENEFI